MTVPRKLLWLLLACALICGAIVLMLPSGKSHPGVLAGKTQAPSSPSASSTQPPPASPAQSAAVPANAKAVRTGVPAVDPESMARFADWTQRYLQAGAGEREKLVAEGVELAKARRPFFKELVKGDPRRALEQAVPMVTRLQLPSQVVRHLEERVSGRAALRTYQGVGEDNRTPVRTARVAEFSSGEAYDAHV